ncbi:MAG: 4Fe-4S dicluster domain-containing protein [Candidatus Bathyarchaeota archaeon]|nr:4Fe-4S dicluster domain-containing protein [Candidatus Bathyarchaeota archaeon]MCX8177614.1 4Fe-4S dicluster domain-containing protein [Candidatus Bathyarchaeota archaeon]MDW8193871.1 4Fe-4S dicluster domain-containing protein [Nitrososphaerota archaeon]
MAAQERTSSDFTVEIKQTLGGESITRCYQCGTCASSCPVAKMTDRYNPREVIRLALLGQRENVLGSDTIWLCASCYQCQERCPQEVEIADVIYALRNIAIREGKVPKIYAEFAATLTRDGRLVSMSKFLEKKRIEYGLPPLKPTGVEAIRKILSATGFDKLPISGMKGEST